MATPRLVFLERPQPAAPDANSMRTATQVTVTRLPEKFLSDDRRVITRFFVIGGEDRIRSVLRRVANLDNQQVRDVLARVLRDFGGRHRDIESTLLQHFENVQEYMSRPDQISRERRLLIGAYFTMEYSIESAALFNPSIVPHPDQSNLDEGELRFLLSLRATGEGHISSIVFRTGIINAAGDIEFDPPSRFAARMRLRQDRNYEKKLFFLKLVEMAAYNDTARLVLDELPEHFTFAQLDAKLTDIRSRAKKTNGMFSETLENMRWLARSNYHLELAPGTDPADIVIFPTSDNESRGIEDARLTRFIDDDGSVTYFGTYTAYNGFRILPQLFETKDFRNIAVHTLNGRHVQNKGMALFPRKINGLYYMASRLDGENMFIMRSENVHFWNEAEKLQAPRYPWEFVQIGNCGAPIETEAGWLLLTHGVGPMRQYCIGVSLLDLDDPSKVIGHLDEPLLVPEEHERDGYVPNVVYSCGALAHGDQLIIPYAISDRATTFASLNLKDLLDAVLSNGGLTRDESALKIAATNA